MIPITAGKTLDHIDPQDGVIYRLRYLLDEHQDEFFEVMDIADGAGNDPRKNFEYCNRLIDLFMVGWEGKGIPEFPADRKPSRCFLLGDKQRLVEVIMGHVNELTGMQPGELKNSSRPPQSPASGRSRKSTPAAPATQD